MKTPLVIATGNAHKVQEFVNLLESSFDVEDLHSVRKSWRMPEETGKSFAENARIKALALASVCGEYVLADDSGLEVDALGGAPGIYSARFAGENAGDAENRAKLLAALAGVPVEERSARFWCALCLVKGASVVLECDGVCEGRILDGEQGAGGFGYDPLFVPTGHEESFAQMGQTEKDLLSHRGRATLLLVEQWTRLQNENGGGRPNE
ncbi:MAG: RdgB/HAM1 family non-canonical purine NTP pyrophosphatase [Verrucomicrobiales bacterium]